MEKEKIGKLLIVVGIIIAIVSIVSIILISAYTFYAATSASLPGLGALVGIGPYAFFIIGIIIAIVGEVIRKW